MKLSWIFNGSVEAHHLAAVYVAVWLIQGGYACWIGLQWMRVSRRARLAPPVRSATRGRS